MAPLHGQVSSDTGPPPKRARPYARKQANIFSKDLKSMMYAFGDEDPTPESVAVMEDILHDYITSLCTTAARNASSGASLGVRGSGSGSGSGSGGASGGSGAATGPGADKDKDKGVHSGPGSTSQKVKVDDFKFALRRDGKKLGRVEELLVMQKEIAQAKKLFDDKEEEK